MQKLEKHATLKRQISFEMRRKQEKETTIERESEECQRKEIRKTQRSIGANLPDETISELWGSTASKGEFKQAQEKGTQEPEVQENSLADVKKTEKAETTSLWGTLCCQD